MSSPVPSTSTATSDATTTEADTVDTDMDRTECNSDREIEPEKEKYPSDTTVAQEQMVEEYPADPTVEPEKEKPPPVETTWSAPFPVPDRNTSLPQLLCKSAPDAFGTAHYTRGVFFSPDGLCVLAMGSDHTLRLSELPQATPASSEENSEPLVSPCLSMRENETVYDACWYPLMNSSQPDTCCFAVTAHGQPIHLYDAFDGSIRATYRCFNHLDELDSAHSLAFDATGARLFAGIKNDLRVFDVAVPGKVCEQRKIWTRKDGGQAGIISTIATNPVLNDIYALGTFSRSVGVYLEGHNRSNNHLLCLLEGQTGGVTHLKFTGDGTFLLAGGRKDNEILVWDMRNPGRLYASLPRVVSTNQRVYFDVHPTDHRTVVTGNTDGTVRVFDLSAAPEQEEGSLQPVWTGRGMHRDCVNGVSFHPYRSLLATCSGQRRVRKLPAEFQDSDEETAEEQEEPVPECEWKVWDYERLRKEKTGGE